jgi:hypothetical protein
MIDIPELEELRELKKPLMTAITGYFVEHFKPE